MRCTETTTTRTASRPDSDPCPSSSTTFFAFLDSPRVEKPDLLSPYRCVPRTVPMCSGLASTPHQPLRPALMRAVPIASELAPNRNTRKHQNRKRNASRTKPETRHPTLHSWPRTEQHTRCPKSSPARLTKLRTKRGATANQEQTDYSTTGHLASKETHEAQQMREI